MEEREPSHYDVLGIGPDATKAEVENAYLARSNRDGVDAAESLRLERARRVLADPNLRRRYEAERRQDEQERSRPPRPRRGAGALDPARARKLVVVLAGLVVVLALVGGVVVWPMLAQRIVTHSPGTELVARDGSPYATVLAFEPRHRFAGGVSADAYQLRLRPSGKEVWITKEEVNQIGRRP